MADGRDDRVLGGPSNGPGLARLLRAAGWTDVEYRNLSGGIVALHRATRP